MSLSSFGKLLFAIAWVAAAVFVGSQWAADHESVRILAAILVAAPTGLTIGGRLIARFVPFDEKVRKDIEEELRDGLVTLYRQKLCDPADDITHVSMHVWALPRWYRWLKGIRRTRNWIKHRRSDAEEEEAVAPRLVEPRLKRIAACRIRDSVKRSGVKFRVGESIIGRCIDANEERKSMSVALDSTEFQEALKDEPSWKSADVEIHQDTGRRRAQKLSLRYGQVAAVVLQDGGHAIGCVTLDLPPGAKTRLTKNSNNEEHPVMRFLAETAERVEPFLAARSWKAP